MAKGPGMKGTRHIISDTVASRPVSPVRRARCVQRTLGGPAKLGKHWAPKGTYREGSMCHDRTVPQDTMRRL